ncbi:toxin-antitoxin system YwqK family antitoxin [Paenibacillus amylolyticus]|uniref:Toxin-antitoxin system YwqK family antitoxin n=1 Tax=Paenibacillus amylolyticus TaxID=1451 RepID=A0A117I234_PAEAM|nr:hypothetical protein [Paenibacillus amylolyticus]GAS83207.1 unknown protein [Paenibacillus amylolyticus]
MLDYNLLSIEEVLLEGIEFEGEVCFSGKYGQEVFDKPIEDGGHPISGLLYERYKNGNMAYYSYYKNGLSEGNYVEFYEDGKAVSFQQMIKGVVHGKSNCWYKDGNIKSVAEYKYGFKLIYKEWDANGLLLTEKTEPSDFEKEMIDKYDAWVGQDGR